MNRPPHLSRSTRRNPGLRAFACGLSLLSLVACSESTAPTAPSGEPSPGLPAPGPPAAAYALTGRVSSDARALPESQVEVLTGANTGQKTTTAPDGTYLFPELRAGEMTVRASAAGYQARAVTVVLDANKSADFTLSPESIGVPRTALSGVVLGSVSAGGATALASARVTITSGSDQGRAATTDAGGRYTLVDLAREEVTVEASAPGYVTASSRVDLREDESEDFRLAAAPVEAAVLTGRLVDVLSQNGIAGVTVAGESLTAAPSDASGTFRATSVSISPGVRPIVVSGAGVFERRMHLQVPGADLLVSLISAGFDMAAFDQMFRDPGLRRWTSAPPLVIEQRALQFTDVNMDSGLAGDAVMTPDESQALVGDLLWALPQLSGGQFNAFQGVTTQTTAAGTRVPLLRGGVITVARVSGLTAATGKWGWGRWLYDGSGAVIGGLVMLDDEFDRSASPYRRALRAHELGHALGYAHVNAQPSVMNPSGRVEPTSFDRDATRVAFERTPGSRSPDIDPEPGRTVQRAGPAAWSAPLY